MILLVEGHSMNSQYPKQHVATGISFLINLICDDNLNSVQAFKCCLNLTVKNFLDIFNQKLIVELSLQQFNLKVDKTCCMQRADLVNFRSPTFVNRWATSKIVVFIYFS